MTTQQPDVDVSVAENRTAEPQAFHGIQIIVNSGLIQTMGYGRFKAYIIDGLTPGDNLGPFLNQLNALGIPANGSYIITSDGETVVLASAPEQRVLTGAHSPRDVGMDKLLIINEEMEIVERYVQHDGTPQTATYEDLTNANLIGYFAVEPRVTAYNVGQWYWNVRSRRARVVTDLDPLAAGEQKGWDYATLTELIPGDEAFTGNFPDDAAAGAEVAAVNDIYFRYQGDMKLRVCRSITPGETAIESFRFKRLLNVHDLESIERTTALLSENTAALRLRLEGVEDAAQDDRTNLANERADRASGDDIQIRTIGDADTYNEEVGNQQAAKTPLLIHIGVAIAGTYNGQDYAWPAGQILYVKPLLTALEFPDPWFVLHDSSETSGQTAAQVQAAIRALLNPETAARVAGDQIQRVQAANAAAYEAALTDQRTSAMGLFIVATADFTATVAGVQHEVTSGDVIYFAPLSVSPKRLFTLPNNTTGRTEAQVNDQIDAKLPPFSDVSLWPVGVPSSAVPENLYVNLGDPNARANDITTYTVFVHGTEVTRATNLPGRYKVSGGVLPIPISLTDRTTIAGNFRDGITFYPVIIRFTFSDTSSHDHELQMLVNNPEFAEPTEWPGDVFVIPHELPIFPIAATTFTVIPRIAAGAYPTGARMRITIGGVSGAYHTLADNQERTLALTLVQMQNAVQAGASRGWLIGSVTIHPADADTQLDRIQFQIPLTSNRHHGALAYAAATAMNADRFDVVDLTLTGNTTFNITGGNDGDSAMLRVIQGGTANYTVTLNAAISRGGRDAPVVATANNARSYLMFTKVGATWVYLGAITDE